MENLNLFFDLDGTLTDPAMGITNSVIHALKHFGINVADRNILLPFIGPPLIDSFMKYYQMTPEKAREAVTYYREYFCAGGMFENKIYPNIPEVLQTLSAWGCRLAVTSSKPQPFVEKILEHFDLRKYFVQIVGATLDERRLRKDEVIHFALEESGIDRGMVIGDHAFDVKGAHDNGLVACAVLYGYGNTDDILAQKPEFTAMTPIDILTAVKSFKS